MKKVSIYSTPTCHFCGMAKDLFNANKIPYTEYNVATDMAKRKEMIDMTHQMGVPVINIDGKWIVGYDERTLKGLLGV